MVSTTAFIFITFLVFLFLLIFIMPRVLYFATLIYYAFNPKHKGKSKQSYYLKDFKESKKKKIIL